MMNGGQGIGELMLMKSAMGGAENNPQQAPMQAPVSAGIQKPQESALKILTNYFQNRGIPLQQGMAAVQKQIAEGLKLLQFKNSVMAIKELEKGVAQIHFFSLDTQEQLKEDIQHFIDLLRKAGVHTIYDKDADPTFMQAAQQLGVKIQQPDRPEFKLKATL